LIYDRPFYQLAEKRFFILRYNNEKLVFFSRRAAGVTFSPLAAWGLGYKFTPPKRELLYLLCPPAILRTVVVKTHTEPQAFILHLFSFLISLAEPGSKIIQI
jgi:hypothetical protein